MDYHSKNLILHNAKVITLDTRLPHAEWVVIRDGRIFQIGSGRDWKNIQKRKDRIINLDGKTAFPGFIDAHMHIAATIKKHLSLDLTPQKNTSCVSDIQAAIHNQSRHIPPGKWIFGRGYNEHYLPQKKHPNRWDLDKVAAGHPVKLTHRSGHTHVLNSLGLKIIGITRESGDPDGGIIDRDLTSGEPTGILYGLGDFLSKSIPPLQTHELESGLEKVNQMLLSFGITSLHDASHRNDLERWKLLGNWITRDKLQPRIHMLQGYASFQRKERNEFSTIRRQNRLTPGAVKIMVDDTTGRVLPEQKELNEMVFEAHSAGMQVAFHAINEPSIDTACRSIASALEKLPEKKHRHRIEHCSLCTPILAKRIASLNMSVVTQPPFVFHSGERYVETVPKKQLEFLYPIRTLLSHGINTAASSDSPVVPPDPLTGVYAAVTRSSENRQVVVGHEKITVMEALRMYTLYAARTSFEENIKGTISPGKLADLVVLDADPTRIPADHLKTLAVDMTIIDGEVVWQRNI